MKRNYPQPMPPVAGRRKNMKSLKLVVGHFALVDTGNCTQGYIIDGPNVQARANKNYPKYYGDTCHIYQRGIEGAGIVFEGEEDGITLHGLYKNAHYAQVALDEIIAYRKAHG